MFSIDTDSIKEILSSLFSFKNLAKNEANKIITPVYKTINISGLNNEVKLIL